MIVAIDFDGTITDDVNGKTFNLRPNVLKNLQRLKDMGVEIWIYSTRTNLEQKKKLSEMGIDCEKELFDTLEKYRIPYDKVLMPEDLANGKPLADVFVDDKAIGFVGDWDKIYQELKSRKEKEE